MDIIYQEKLLTFDLGTEELEFKPNPFGPIVDPNYPDPIGPNILGTGDLPPPDGPDPAPGGPIGPISLSNINESLIYDNATNALLDDANSDGVAQIAAVGVELNSPNADIFVI